MHCLPSSEETLNSRNMGLDIIRPVEYNIVCRGLHLLRWKDEIHDC